MAGLLTTTAAAFADEHACKNMLGYCVQLSHETAIQERAVHDQLWLEIIKKAVAAHDIDPKTVFVNIPPFSVPQPSSHPITQQHITPVSSILSNDDGSRVLVITITRPQLLQVGWYVLNSSGDDEFTSQPWVEDGKLRAWAREWDRNADRGNTLYPQGLERFVQNLPRKYAFFHAIFQNSSGRALASFENNVVFALANCTDDASQLLKAVVQAALDNEDGLPDFETLIAGNAAKLRSVAPACLRVD